MIACKVIVFLLFMLGIKHSLDNHGEQRAPKYWPIPFLAIITLLLLLSGGGFFSHLGMPQILYLSAIVLSFGIEVYKAITKEYGTTNAYSAILSGLIWQGILFWGGFYSIN